MITPQKSELGFQFCDRLDFHLERVYQKKWSGSSLQPVTNNIINCLIDSSYIFFFLMIIELYLYQCKMNFYAWERAQRNFGVGEKDYVI